VCDGRIRLRWQRSAAWNQLRKNPIAPRPANWQIYLSSVGITRSSDRCVSRRIGWKCAGCHVFGKRRS
jgi:hypothetical protein